MLEVVKNEDEWIFKCMDIHFWPKLYIKVA